jgi:SAM-dependent methyltransferase
MSSQVALLKRRGNYGSYGSPDDFIVSVLRDEIEPFLAERLPRCTVPRVLDIGCGEQPFRPLVEALGGSYVGLDVEQNARGSVEFVASISDELPAEVRAQVPFQLGLCTEVLEHVLDWSKAFENLASLLAPGGHLLVTCPFVYPLHEEPEDYWRPTSHALRFHAERQGFEVIEVRRVGGPWQVLGTLLGHTRLSPHDRSIRARAAFRIARVARGCLDRLLRRGTLQSLLDASGAYFLSNVVVLKRR